MNDFRPYEPVRQYTCVLTKDEALLIQKIRDTKYGYIKISMAGGEITRTETAKSELTKDRRDDSVTIAVEIESI